MYPGRRLQDSGSFCGIEGNILIILVVRLMRSIFLSVLITGCGIMNNFNKYFVVIVMLQSSIPCPHYGRCQLSLHHLPIMIFCPLLTFPLLVKEQFYLRLITYIIRIKCLKSVYLLTFPETSYPL